MEPGNSPATIESRLNDIGKRVFSLSKETGILVRKVCGPESEPERNSDTQTGPPLSANTMLEGIQRLLPDIELNVQRLHREFGFDNNKAMSCDIERPRLR